MNFFFFRNLREEIENLTKIQQQLTSKSNLSNGRKDTSSKISSYFKS
jgi:hypothetical protein